MDEARREDTLSKVLGILENEHGIVGREVPGAFLLLPAEVEITDGVVRYVPAGFLRLDATGQIASREAPKPRRTVLGAIDQFVKLAFPSQAERLSSSDIAKFVKRWGGLGLCPHGLPYTHQPIQNILIDPASNLTRCLPTIVDGMFAEPIERWRVLAARAFEVLQIAAHVRRTGDSRTGQKKRRALIDLVNAWLSEGGVTIQLTDVAPQYRWPGGVEFRLNAGISLYGMLAAQLAMAVTLSRQIYVCAECGKLFTPDPSHRPRVGGRVFCLECGRPAAVRHAMRAMRERRRLKQTAGSGSGGGFSAEKQHP